MNEIIYIPSPSSSITQTTTWLRTTAPLSLSRLLNHSTWMSDGLSLGMGYIVAFSEARHLCLSILYQAHKKHMYYWCIAADANVIQLLQSIHIHVDFLQ